MLTTFKMNTVKVKGKYNHVKSSVLITLYCFEFWYGIKSMSIKLLAMKSGVKLNYLYDRLPVFAGKRPYPLTKKLWHDPIVKRRLVVVGNRPGYQYSLTKAGKDWVTDKLPRDDFKEIAFLLEKNWPKAIKNY